ncbi:MATE family efflux transporter [Planctomycetota bacterium]
MWQDIKEAIAGSEQDFTQGGLRRAVFLLAVPMVLEMAMESVFAVVDIYFVSRLGTAAVATVGVTEAMITLIYALAMGFSLATTAMVSRRIGEKRPELASRAAFQAIVTGLFVATVIAIPGCIYATTLLRLMGASAETATSLSGYTAVMLGGNAVIMLLFIINAVFRSAGDAAISMRVLWLANILNMILDPILIFGLGPIPELGITGAAIATTIGRGVAVLVQFAILFSGRTRVKLGMRDLVIHLPTIRRLVRLALGGIGQNIIAMSSWIGLMRIMMFFGEAATAGYTIAIRVLIFALLPSWGVSNAAATLVGQNLGAQQPERAEASALYTGKVNMVVMGLISLVLIFFPRILMQPFVQDAEVLQYGITALRIMSYGFVAYGLGMVMVQALNGAGDTVTPTKINLCCFWLLEIPLAYVLSIVLGVGESGVCYAIITAETAMAVSALVVFKRGKWKKKDV